MRPDDEPLVGARRRWRGSGSTARWRCSPAGPAREVQALVDAGDGPGRRRARWPRAAGSRPASVVELLAEPAGGRASRRRTDVPVVVRYEDDDVIVVAKPAGLVVHPGAGHPRRHARQRAARALPGDRRASATRRGPGIVHRLDRDTSGLLVVARTRGRVRRARRRCSPPTTSSGATSRSCGACPTSRARRDRRAHRPVGRGVRRGWRCARAGARARTAYEVVATFRDPDVGAARVPARDRAHPPDPRAPRRRSATRSWATPRTAGGCVRGVDARPPVPARRAVSRSPHPVTGSRHRLVRGAAPGRAGGVPRDPRAARRADRHGSGRRTARRWHRPPAGRRLGWAPNRDSAPRTVREPNASAGRDESQVRVKVPPATCRRVEGASASRRGRRRDRVTARRGSRARGPRRRRTATRGGDALAVARRPPSDVVLLDLGLPDRRRVRRLPRAARASDVPIIVVTARGDEVDRVVGLELGADDYVVKPFGFRELVARIRAVAADARRGPRRTTEPTARTATARWTHARRSTGAPDASRSTAPRSRSRPRSSTCSRSSPTTPARCAAGRSMLDEVWDPHWYGPTKTLDVHVGVAAQEARRPGLDRDGARRRVPAARPPSDGGA